MRICQDWRYQLQYAMVLGEFLLSIIMDFLKFNDFPDYSLYLVIHSYFTCIFRTSLTKKTRSSTNYKRLNLEHSWAKLNTHIHGIYSCCCSIKWNTKSGTKDFYCLSSGPKRGIERDMVLLMKSLICIYGNGANSVKFWFIIIS